MNKRLLVKSLLALILITALSYTAFWFFKAHQIKKNITMNSDIKSDGLNVEVGDITVTGFPLSYQTVVKNVKISSVEEGKSFGNVVINHLDIESNIAGSRFVVNTAEPIVVDTQYGTFKFDLGDAAALEFAIDEEGLTLFKYKSALLKIFLLGEEKATDLVWDVKDVDTSFVKTVMEMGETSRFKYQDAGSELLGNANNMILYAASSFNDVSWTIENSGTITANIILNAKGSKTGDLKYLSDLMQSKFPAVVPMDISEIYKNEAQDNVAEVSLNFVLTPNKEKFVYALPPEQMAKIAPDMKKYYQKALPAYNVDAKLEKWNYSNSLYGIFMNANVVTSPDDVIPSGLIRIKIDHFNNFIEAATQKVKSIKKMVDPLIQSAEERRRLMALENNREIEARDSSADDEKMAAITNLIVHYGRKLAASNALSEEDSLVFDIQRDQKGQYPSINTIPVMQILEEVKALYDAQSAAAGQ